MEDAHTPAGYFIAIIAVIGGAFLMPSFPIFIMVVGPLLLLGIVTYSILKGKRRQRHLLSAMNCVRSTECQSHSVAGRNELHPYSHAPVAVSQSRTVSGM